MDRTEHNGWTNYETWLTNLWIGNEQGSHTYWREAATEEWERAEERTICTMTFSRRVVARKELADRLKREVYEENPELPSEGIVADMLGAAFSEVNWYEIAEQWLLDAVGEEEKEEEEE